MTVVRIAADDLTGALDAAAPLATLTGPLPVVGAGTWSPARAGSYALDTESRDARSGDPRWLQAFDGADLAFQKIDSQLRGRTAADIARSLASGRFASAIIAPAFPRQQRITRAGRQLWRAGPDDPWQPVAHDLRSELAERGLAVRLASRPADIAAPGLWLGDATTEADLDAIVAAGQRLPGPVLWVGSAGLARALAGDPAPLAAAGPVAPLLLVIGSHHPVTLAQLAMLGPELAELTVRVDPRDQRGTDRALDRLAPGLATRGCAVLILSVPDGTGAGVARPLFDRVLGRLPTRLRAPATLLASGGSTLLRLVRALGAESLLVLGELEPGIATSELQGGAWSGARVISKSGGFGAPSLLNRLVSSAIWRT